MVDPSILTSERGLQWLESNREGRSAIVLSEAFYNALFNPTESFFLRQLSSPEGRLRLQRLRGLLESVRRFEAKDVRLPESIEEVKETLMSLRGYDNRIFADEWAFIHSQSWMIARTERALKAFRRAGAGVLEFGRRLRDEFVDVVVPQRAMPQIISRQFLAIVGAKWFVVGVAAAAGGALGGIGGGLAGLPAVPVVRAFDA